MKRFFLTTLVAGLLLSCSSTALAAASQNGGYVPSDQSAAAQYTEDVPTAGGATPALGIRAGHGPHSIPGGTLRELDSSPTGARAAALAESLAPTASPAPATAHGSRHPHHHRGTPARDHSSPSVTAAPAASIQATRTISGPVGLNVALVVVLGAILVLVSGAGIVRMRHRR